MSLKQKHHTWKNREAQFLKNQMVKNKIEKENQSYERI
jgi:hypothetical protein